MIKGYKFETEDFNIAKRNCEINLMLLINVDDDRIIQQLFQLALVSSLNQEKTINHTKCLGLDEII